jgi:hypothetical protein
VFTGNWADVFRLRTVSTPESRVREVEVFGELSPASVLKRGLNDDADADDGGDEDEDKNDEKSFASAPVDVVAHVERVVSSWKKRCRMPGDGSVNQANGTGCVGVDGFVHRTWWPCYWDQQTVRAIVDYINRTPRRRERPPGTAHHELLPVDE